VWWILGDAHVLNPTAKLTYADLNIGIRNMVVCVEMVPFSLFFHYAYSYRPYVVRSDPVSGMGRNLVYKGGFLGIKAWMQVWNPREMLQAIAFAFQSWGELKRARSYELLDRRPPAYSS
jgi:Organic solute transporter Ostalpha